MKIISAHSPKWSDNKYEFIQLFVTFDSLGELPFTASKSDPEPHGQEIWHRALSGEFGEIAPYIEPEKTPEQLLAEAKAERVQAVASIVVITSSGTIFDGNEQSQDRMSRAVLSMEEEDELPWVLADNTVATVGKAELQEALRLAGIAMAEIWIRPYQP